MSLPRFDLLTLSRAYVDVIADVPDEFLTLFKVKKAVVLEVTGTELMTMRSHLTKFRLYPGGSMANTAVGMAALGAKTAFLGKVANDEEGRFFRTAFRQGGVAFPNQDHPPQKKAHTGTNVVLKTPDGVGTVISATGVADSLTVEDIFPEMIARSAIFYPEANYLLFKESPIVLQAIEVARAAKSLIVMGLQGLELPTAALQRKFRQNCPADADIILGNRLEFSQIMPTEEFFQYKDGPTLLVMTDGKNGVFLAGQGNYLHVPPHRLGYHPHTVGVGDQFAAGFLFGILKKLPLSRCVELGSETADAMLSIESARPIGSWQDIADRYVKGTS